MNNRLAAISIVFLGICILISSWVVSDSLRVNAEPSAIVSKESATSHQLLTEGELAKYLGLSDEDVKKLLPITNSSGFTLQSEFPVVKIGDTFYFSVSAVNKWLQDEKAANFSMTNLGS